MIGKTHENRNKNIDKENKNIRNTNTEINSIKYTNKTEIKDCISHEERDGVTKDNYHDEHDKKREKSREEHDPQNKKGLDEQDAPTKNTHDEHVNPTGIKSHEENYASDCPLNREELQSDDEHCKAGEAKSKKRKGHDEHDTTKHSSGKDGLRKGEQLADGKGEWMTSNEGTGPTLEGDWNNINIWLKDKHGLRWINRVMEEGRTLLSFYHIDIN